MPRRDPLTLVHDMLQAISALQRFTSERSFGDYVADELLISAVERQLILLGEAMAQLRRHHPHIANSLADCARIIGFRNVLVHGYGAVKHSVVWDVLQDDLPDLKQQLQALLDQDPLA